LLGTLEKLHQKLTETQRRLDMKLVRPVVEDSRRDIDEELERATTSLLQSELAIKNQLFDVETRRQRLILLYQDIETELQSKRRAHAVDVKCLEAQIGSAGCSGVAGGGSGGAAASSRHASPLSGRGETTAHRRNTDNNSSRHHQHHHHQHHFFQEDHVA